MIKRIATPLLLAVLTLIVSGCPQNLPPDFRVESSVSNVQIHQGDSQTVGLRILPLHGFSGQVSIALKLQNSADLPAGINYTPAAVTVTDNPLDVTLIISASDSVPVGSYAATMIFSSGKISHSLGLGIDVVPPAGSLDASFGSNGVTIVNDLTQTQGEDDLAYSLAFGSNAIYLLGRSNDQLVVSKLDADGNFDGSFAGGTGVATLANLQQLSSDTLDFDLDRAMAVILSNKLMVTGYAHNGNDDLLLARLNPDGSLDTGFGGSGVIVYDNLAGGNGNDRGYSLRLTRDGYLVSGMSYKDASDTEQFVLASFDNGGSLGKVAVGGGSEFDALYSLAATNDVLVAAGETVDGGSRKGLWARFAADLGVSDSKSLDAFAGGRVRSLAPSDDGGFYLAGYTYNGSDFDLVVEKLQADGAVDEDFGNGGVVVLDKVAGGSVAGSDRAFSVTVDGEGRILVAGRSFVSGRGDDLVVVRLNPDGSLDDKFGTGGVFAYDGGNGNDGAFEVALDSYGRIVVVGYTTNSGGDLDLLALRLNP